jgi:hypothetical protein
VVAQLVAPTSVCAQEQNSSERAQTLFDSGRALMQEGKFSEACAKFAESQTLDPGGGTILNLGMCRKREGRTGTAFKVLNEALARARTDGRSDRVATAERELAELAPNLSRLTVQLGPGASAPDLAIELDGERLAPSSVGQSLPLDPGTHQLRASRPGYQPWSLQIALAPVADQQTFTVPALSPSLPAPVPMPIAPAAAVPLTSQPRQADAPPPEKNPHRVLGFALVSTGGVALVAGSYFGIRALSLKASSNEHWNGTYCTAPSCVDDWNDAKTSAHLSTLGLSIGVAAISVGAYFLLRPSTSSQTTVALSVSASGSDARALATGHF